MPKLLFWVSWGKKAPKWAQNEVFEVFYGELKHDVFTFLHGVTAA